MDYYICEIITRVPHWPSAQTGATDSKMIVQAATRRPQTARKVAGVFNPNRLHMAVRRPYSPDLAP
jgi:hypothetical protein